VLPPDRDEFSPRLAAEHPVPADHYAGRELIAHARPAVPATNGGGTGLVRPDVLSAGPDPVELLKCLKRRWLLATVAGFVAAVTCVALAFMFWPMEYEVDALLRVARDEESLLQSGPVYRDPKAFDTYRRTQMTLLRSPLVLAAALRDEAINQLPVVRQQSDPVSWLEDELLLDYPGDSEVLRVRMKGTQPDQLAKIVNSVVAAYLEEIVQAESREKLRIQDLLKKQLAKVKQEFYSTNQKYIQIAKDMGSADLESVHVQQRMMFTQLSDAQTSLRQLKATLMRSRIERFALEADLEHLKQDPKGMEYLIEAELLKDPIYAEKFRELGAIELALMQRAEVLRDPQKSGSYTQMSAYRDQLQAEMDEMKQEKMPILRELVLGDSVAGVEAKIVAKKQEEELIQENIDETIKGIAALQAQINRVGHTSADLEARAADVDQLREFGADLRARLDQLALDLQRDARVRLIQEAAQPETGEILKYYFVIALAGMGGLTIALFGVSYWEFQARRINSSEQLTQGLGMPVVGTLPALDQRGSMAVLQRTPRHALEGLLTASIDSIRTALVHNSNGNSPRVIMVTSPGDGEGKTTVASQLATSLARGGRRTLLVDGDLRSPTAHKLFELSLEDGLCEVLRGSAELDYAIRPTRAVGLWLLSAGQWNPEVIHELDKPRAKEVFDKLRAQFDFVVVDSAPVLSVADTLLIGQHADAAVMSLLQNVSRVPRVYEATERLQSVGVHVLGAVFGGVSRTGSLRRIHDVNLPASA